MPPLVFKVHLCWEGGRDPGSVQASLVSLREPGTCRTRPRAAGASCCDLMSSMGSGCPHGCVVCTLLWMADSGVSACRSG